MPKIRSEVFELVDRIAAASTIADVWEAILGTARQVGLPYGVAGYMPLSKAEPIKVVTNALPAGWLEEYGTGIDRGDLVAGRARKSAHSFEWRMSDWDPATLPPLQRQWHALNLKYGLLGGLAIMDFRRGENMMMVLSGHDGQIEDHDRLALYFAGQEAITQLRELSAVSPPAHAPLSSRERECLQWAAAGKTDWEIGEILSLSEKTVNVYVTRAKNKLGVGTRAQAVVVAVRNGLIHPDV